MFDFKEIELSDKEWIDPLLRLSDYRGADYCFTNLFVWRHAYCTRVARWNDFLLIRVGDAEAPTDIFPGGTGDVKKLINTLLDTALRECRDFNMAVVGAKHASLLQQWYPGLFEVTPVRNSWDYIYSAEDLRLLSGKHFQPKRNHIARFAELPDWKYELITTQNIAECSEMNDLWCQQMGCAQNSSLHMEMCAAVLGLRHFEALRLEGALLRVANRVVAYTLGEPLNSDTYVVHIEKAFPDIRGAYQMINREFIRHIGDSFLFVNREDDAGDEGLRKAKNSYHPAFMEEKYFFAVPYNSLSLRR